MKYFVAAICAALLYGCGGGGDSGPDLSANPVVLSAGNQVVRLDRNDRYSLTISSNDNRVTFAGTTRLDALRVNGTGNTVALESGATATSVEVAGANNAVAFADHVTANSVLISGANASLDIAAADSVPLLSIPGSNATVRITDASATVTRLEMAGSNAMVIVPRGYTARMTVVDTGANNRVVEQ